MLTSPLTLTIDGASHSLSRINQDNFGATYLKKGTDYEVKLQIRHTTEKSSNVGQFERHNVDLTWTTFDAMGNPITTQAYEVIRSKRGTDGSLAVDLSAGLNAFVNTNAAAIVGWES